MAYEDPWPDIEQKMLSAKKFLAANGCIFERTGASLLKRNVIRYREYGCGDPVRRSIWLGDTPEVVRRAQELLDEWQVGRHPRHCSDPFVQDAWKAIDSVSPVLSRRDRELLMDGCKMAANNLVMLFEKVVKLTTLSAAMDRGASSDALE